MIGMVLRYNNHDDSTLTKKKLDEPCSLVGDTHCPLHADDDPLMADD